MKHKYILLVLSIVICLLSIALVMIKGKIVDRVNFDSVSEVVESLLHHIDKTGHVITAMTDGEEMEIGDKIYKKTLSSQIAKKSEDTPLHKYVTDVGNLVGRNVKREKIRYEFHILELYYPNAFASPGGHIYVTIGLLQKLDSEAELAAILGHEIAHVDAKHSIGQIQYKIAAEKILGIDLTTYADIGYRLLFKSGYSEIQEKEADEGGLYLAYRAGYHPLGLIYAFKNILKKESPEAERSISVTPIGDTLKATAEMIKRYFATHPYKGDRFDNIEKYIIEKRMIKSNKKYYIGQKNYLEKKSFNQAFYKDEFNNKYILKEVEGKEGI